MPSFRDRTGERFTRLVAIRPHKERLRERIQWVFQCDCGKRVVLIGDYVFSGKQKSCGCLHRELAIEKNKTYCTKHGMNGTPTHKSWQSMIRRCTYEPNPSFKSYGGSGIKICPEWYDFQNFYRDMGERPVGKTLDRIDNSLGYFKDNCRWSTPKQQAINRTSTVFVEFRGVKKTLSDWDRFLGFGSGTLAKRLANGWGVKLSLTTRALTPKEATLYRHGKLDLRDREFRIKDQRGGR